MSKLTQKMEKTLVLLPKKDVDMIKQLIHEGRYITKSDFFRAAIKQLLYGEERMKRFEELTKELQETVRRKGISKKSLNESLEKTEQETREKMRRLLAETS
ncbi:MAG: hypothetical protein HYW24_02615 [Candidatus Aenigmarchaeota archaeon]|nr:hypothetical protein [Candidatus Aenigmarchaeota archaeon]